ncbi:uncharacterized protein [Drosophila tropicalis]|uniref:uncharacterized protein n=1 Tax=Drosophila tropicalis TaxID=46794 RepID=UPI0035ABD219
MLNTRGPKQERRMLLMSVVKSQILYAAQIWAPAMEVESYCRLISPTYRICALRVCSAFRSVSEDAELVVAGMVPIDILAAEVRATAEATSRGILKSEMTHRLIPNIEAWVGRKHGQLSFYLTQVLSGHVCFRQYLNRQRAERAIGQSLSVASSVPSMLESKDNWASVSTYFGVIMRELRRLDRERVGSA